MDIYVSAKTARKASDGVQSSSKENYPLRMGNEHMKIDGATNLYYTFT